MPLPKKAASGWLCWAFTYWSLGKGGWSSPGPFGRTVLPLEDALRFIASEDIFWVLI